MFDKALKYSYAEQKRERHRLLRVIMIFLFLFFLYNVICAFFVSVWVLNNDTMEPGMRAGDRYIVYSSFLPFIISRIDKTGRTGGGGGGSPFKRGNTVLIDTRRGGNRNWFLVTADNFIRFVTAQQKEMLNTDEHLYIKRIIAIPGDEITMNNFIFRVKPAGNMYFFTEFELSDRPYYPNIPQVPALWDETLPFSGYMDSITLGPGEYFVVSDDRGNSGDSRTWGPVSAKKLLGKPVFRFWPIPRIGRP
jgi:signal peptidase I